MRFVLDASYAVSWVVESEQTPKGLSLLGELRSGRSQAVVPAIWPDEMANVLLNLEKSKKVSGPQIAAWVAAFSRMPLEIEPPSVERSLGEVRLLAQNYGLSVYDARYLHLAVREDLALATLDKQLIKVATRAGAKLLP